MTIVRSLAKSLLEKLISKRDPINDSLNIAIIILVQKRLILKATERIDRLLRHAFEEPEICHIELPFYHFHR